MSDPTQVSTSMQARPVLSCVGLCKFYGALQVTNDLSLSLEKGEVHALIGPNGAGKTSALAQLSGELSSDAGSVILDGCDVTTLSQPERVHAGIARSYQISSILPGFTAQESVELALQAFNGHSFKFFKPASWNLARLSRAGELLELVGLKDAGRSRAGELSHGQTRQLEIAMALASEPKALLLDEPMAGMAHQEAESLAELIAELASASAVLLVEHDMDIVFNVASTISVLSEGQRIAQGSPTQIRSNEDVQRLYLRDDLRDEECPDA